MKASLLQSRDRARTMKDGGSVFIQQWDGKDWVKISDPIAPDTAVVRPLLEEAADKYLADKPTWTTQTCG